MALNIVAHASRKSSILLNASFFWRNSRIAVPTMAGSRVHLSRRFALPCRTFSRDRSV